MEKEREREREQRRDTGRKEQDVGQVDPTRAPLCPRSFMMETIVLLFPFFLFLFFFRPFDLISFADHVVGAAAY